MYARNELKQTPFVSHNLLILLSFPFRIMKTGFIARFFFTVDGPLGGKPGIEVKTHKTGLRFATPVLAR